MVRILFVSFFTFVALSLSISGEAIPAKKLYDDFSTGYLSSDKWFPREYVKEISDGKLVLKLGNSSGMGVEYWPGMFRNNLGVASPEPETITAFESEITIMEATPDSAPNSRSFARIAGQFYNSNESDGQSGEITFEIMIGDRGNGGLEAFWEASRVMENDPSDFEQIESGTLIGPGTLDTGVPYSVKLVYDNDRTLTFTVNGVTDEYTGPEKKRPAVNPVRSIGACIDAANGSNDGFIHTTFDNVVLNNAAEIHEDFSSPLIDLSKWDQTEWVRECSNQHLRANVRSIGGSSNASTYLTTGRDTPYLEAKVRIESDTQLSVGASGIARLGGYYYNETRGTGSGVDYNRYEGDVFAQIRLWYDSEGSTQAQAWIGRSDDADENNFTELFWHTFSTPVQLDTYYVLSITYENDQIIFQCEDELAVFNIQTNAYPPYGMHRQLRTWLFADSGESGNFKASYDDIYIADPPVVTSILSHASPDHTITSGSNEQVYGTSASNVITVESGAMAELINFPGQNSIQILSSSDLFTVSRSGTLVTFQGSDGTNLKIPATETPQIIYFTDRPSLTLSIYNGQVMLDDQVVTTTAAAIDGSTEVVYNLPAIDFDGTGIYFFHTSEFDEIGAWIKVIDHDGISSDGSSHQVTVSVGNQTYRLEYQYNNSPTSAYYAFSVDGLGETGDYIFEVIDPEGNIGTRTDRAEVLQIPPPENISCVVNGTSPIFDWDLSSGANQYAVTIRTLDGDFYYSLGVGTDAPPFIFPPGILEPNTTYTYEIYALDGHSWIFDWDNQSKTPALTYDNPTFTTSEATQVPFTFNHGDCVHTFKDGENPPGISVYINVYDAQGVPDNIDSVSVVLPDGSTFPLELQNSESQNEGGYSTWIDNPIETGNYTIHIQDKDGNEFSYTDYVNAQPLDPPGSINLSINGTEANFSWGSVDRGVYYEVKIYDMENEEVYACKTSDTSHMIPKGILETNKMYKYRLTAHDEFPENDMDNSSASADYDNLEIFSTNSDL